MFYREVVLFSDVRMYLSRSVQQSVIYTELCPLFSVSFIGGFTARVCV